MKFIYDDNNNNILNNIDLTNVHKGTIEVINVLKAYYFCNRCNDSVVWNDVNTDKIMSYKLFIKEYGDDIYAISKELSDMKLCYMCTYSPFGEGIKLIHTQNDMEYRTFFYKDKTIKKNNFPKDVIEMAKQGFDIYNYGTLNVKNYLNLFDDNVSYIITFIKNVNDTSENIQDNINENYKLNLSDTKEINNLDKHLLFML